MKAVAYCRVSSGKQAVDGFLLDAQKKLKTIAEMMTYNYSKSILMIV